jgi:hypothetical protein
MPALTAQLIRQYRSVLGQKLPLHGGGIPTLTPEILQHLGFEIAMSTNPDPTASKAEQRLGPEQAAACTHQILEGGGAGVLYWASPAALKAMLESPAGRDLRPL